MLVLMRILLMLTLMASPFAPALADDYADTIKVFRDAGQSGKFFSKSYGYAVFPTIGKGASASAARTARAACTKRVRMSVIRR